ncbi:hypothetical protein [Vreelandella profundi]|uniref:hypothetical protein n=1 Tax=Vreelandella profundi TaxID=2852117 RepID=UPI001F1CEA05|nr:hypothetical protein [Halomonas profundi]
MKNKIDDLRNHLFAQLERLGDESIKGEKLTEEIRRARAVSEVSAQVVDSARAENERLKITRRQSGTDFLPVGEQIKDDALPRLGGGR